MEPLFVNSIEQAIASIFGEEQRLVDQHPVSGGDINDAFRLSLSDGSNIFMKCNRPQNLSFFQAEAKGLEALRQTGAIGVPEIFAIGTDESRKISFLLMEYLQAAPKIRGYWEVFGRELAALHQADCAGLAGMNASLPFGFGSDNYIGATPQKNTPKKDFITFFRECRLLPQIQLADPYFDPRTRRQWDALLSHLDAYLCEPAHPSLIHGDLWSGNVGCGPDGKAWIFDPAAYVGHFEAELAMTELFGSNPPAFYGAYREMNPIDSGYRDRWELYNLYHLLNHLNLFGRSYLGSVLRILNRYA